MQTPLRAGLAWCDLPFKAAAAQAPNLVLVQFRAPKGQPPELFVVEVLKGRCRNEALNVDPTSLRSFAPRNRDLFLLALDRSLRLPSHAENLGACAAISVLPVRGGKLRAADREDYDGGTRPMTLEELRAELTLATSSAVAGR
ncbi:MAG TPA: hypothetical protein VJS92_16595 [Candidatus Polarisedimenticolaceae bacterium]|nr:hypothetical protein [Candidatus Polarisedimenticolaceae bacterium]